MEFIYEILSHVHSEPKSWPATGTKSTLCTAYYTKITLLNDLKLTVLLLIVNVHITEIVSRAPAAQPNLHFNRAAAAYRYTVRVFSRCVRLCTSIPTQTAQCSSQHIRYSLISLH